MDRRSRLLLVVLALVAAVAVAFLVLDFNASTSETQTNSQSSGYSSGNQDRSAPTKPSGRLSLQVVGNDALTGALERKLVATLDEGATFDGVEAVESIPQGAEDPVLLVEVADRDLLWTPVYSRAHFTVKVTYASDGDLSWRDDKVVRMPGNGVFTHRIRGDFQVEDVTKGVISRRAYDRHLGREAAAQVGKSVTNIVSTPR